MQYSYCSMKSVIGDLIRNTRLQDASYISDAHDWVYEATELMQVRQTLEGSWEDVTIDFHKAPLPCGLVWIDAVEHEGHRLPEGGGVRPAEKDCRISYDDAWFLSTAGKVDTVEGHTSYIGQITRIQSLSKHPRAYYYTDMGSINTSFPQGQITIYFRGVKKDKDGLAMIPDNRNFKLACYWYCRAMMIGAGFEDKQFTFDNCWTMFDKVYAPRAISELIHPSPEQMEHRVNTFQRLLPNDGYYDSFFQADRPEAPYITNL